MMEKARTHTNMHTNTHTSTPTNTRTNTHTNTRTNVPTHSNTSSQTNDDRKNNGSTTVTADAADERWENIIAIVIILLLCVGVGWWMYARLHPAPATQDDVRIPIPLSHSPSLGSGKIVVVMFSDFECSYCGAFSREQFPEIKTKFIDTNTITFIYKHYPLSIHPDAQLAAQASVCAQDQNKFWEYHDALYTHQNALARNDLVGYARDLGLNMTKFTSCVDTAQRENDVAEDQLLGRNAGVTGTPTFFFNGRRVVGAISAADFAAEVQKEQALQK